MEGLKGMFKSKTVWGGAIAALAGVLGIFGYQLEAADQATLAEAISNGAALVGGLLAIYGRVKATKKIG